MKIEHTEKGYKAMEILKNLAQETKILALANIAVFN